MKTWVWTLCGVAIVGAFLLAMSQLTTPDEFSYNGFTFTESSCNREDTCFETIVLTNIGSHRVTFYNDPRELEYQVNRLAVQQVLNMTRSRDTKVYLTFEEPVPGEVGIAMVQLGRILGEALYNIDTEGAFFGDITCEDANENTTVIFFSESSRSGVGYDDHCVFVLAEDVDQIIPVTEAYSMHLLGILP